MLIGCDHKNAQTYRNGSSLTAPENHGQAELKEIILAAVVRYQLDLIAGEANADILRSTRRQSVVYEAACESGIAHRFCEPTWGEKKELAIEEDLPFFGPSPPSGWETHVPSLDVSRRHDIAHRWPVREEVWIDRLGDKLHQNVLFICGDAHKVTLIAMRVGAQTLPQDYFEAYREVRQKGFPPPTG